MHLPLGRLDVFRHEIAGCFEAVRRELEKAVSLYQIEELGFVVQINKADLHIQHAEWGRDCGGRMEME
jgi:hypothetical protein